MVKLLRASIAASLLLGGVLGVEQAVTTACYRRTFPAVQKQCALGYNYDKALTCWAQCPMDFPVECGMECIPQNQDCTKEVVTKVASVAQAFLKTATLTTQFGVASKGLDIGIKCGQQLFGIMEKMVAYSNELDAKFPNTTQDQLVSLAMKSDTATVDMPLAVTTCLNLPVPANMGQIGTQVSDIVKMAAQQVVQLGIAKLTPATFANVTTTMFKGTSAAGVLPSSTADIQQLLDSGSACGKSIKSILDQVVGLVGQMKTNNADATTAMIRIAMSSTPLVTKALPDAINSCSSSASKLTDIRKFADSLLNEIFASSEKGGQPADKSMFAINIANLALGVVSSLDPTGIAAMVQEYLEPLCDSTILTGSMTDGAASDKLGLKTIGTAFQGSAGSWKNAGDGIVQVTFTSADSKDVKVNIKSGGVQIDKVPVKAGGTATWSKELGDLQDKTLYFDRWRPGMLDIPGTGGGSLLLWVPHSSQSAGLNFSSTQSASGHLDLSVKLQG